MMNLTDITKSLNEIIYEARNGSLTQSTYELYQIVERDWMYRSNNVNDEIRNMIGDRIDQARSYLYN